MTDIPAYNEKEISMKDISFMFCADRFTLPVDAGFETTETECRRGTETRSRTAVSGSATLL